MPFFHRNIDLMLPKCNFHLCKMCEVHCQQYQILICIRYCCIGAHKNWLNLSRWKNKKFLKKIQQNKQILKNNKVSNFVNYQSKLKEYLDVSTDKLDIQMVPFKANEVVGREFSIATGLIIGYCQTLLCHIIACKMAFHFYQHKWYIT